MSREAIRAAVVYWFDAQVPGLNTVYGTARRQLDPAAFTAGQPPGTDAGAVGIVLIEQEIERRVAVGLGAWKRVEYTVALDIYHRYTGPDEDAGVLSFDRVVDGVKARLRQDPTLGGVTFQAGEGDNSQLDGVYGEPALNGDVIEMWGAVKFNVTEMVQA